MSLWSRLHPRRTVFALAIFSAMPLLVACPKKPDPVPDAAPPPPPVEEASTTVLVPIEEDAAVDVAPDVVKKATGPAVNTNVARLKQCCNALAAEAKRLGNAPEAATLASAAQQCSVLATQAGPSGTAPELGVLRGILAGRTIPAPCAGF
jgi:hypothetical protein